MTDTEKVEQEKREEQEPVRQKTEWAPREVEHAVTFDEKD